MIVLVSSSVEAILDKPALCSLHDHEKKRKTKKEKKRQKKKCWSCAVFCGPLAHISSSKNY
jgi:hypothetical protein